MRLLRVVGFDPSLRNWGMVAGHVDLKDMAFIPDQLNIVQPKNPEGKTVRANSKDLHLAKTLAKGATEFLAGADVVFVEVPIGSQSARAMASYGICVGVLGSLQAMGRSFIQVTPNEVKLASAGNKTASKDDMIRWATAKYPNLNWPTQKRNGVDEIIAGKAEHLADAIATVEAGLQTNEFQQLCMILRNGQL